MFGDLFGNIQQQQEELQKQLAGIQIEAEAGDQAVIVHATADMQIQGIKIDVSKVDLQDAEQLEDLLIIAVNRALDQARTKAAAETNKLLGNMFPFDNMGDLLGGGPK